MAALPDLIWRKQMAYARRTHGNDGHFRLSISVVSHPQRQLCHVVVHQLEAAVGQGHRLLPAALTFEDAFPQRKPAEKCLSGDCPGRKVIAVKLPEVTKTSYF